MSVRKKIKLCYPINIPFVTLNEFKFQSLEKIVLDLKFKFATSKELEAAGFKRCIVCNDVKVLNEFYHRHANCKICYNLKRQEKYPSNIRLKFQMKEINLKRNHGLTLKEYNLLIQQSNGKCAICEDVYLGDLTTYTGLNLNRKLKKLCCPKCNVAFGMLKGDKLYAQNIINYLKLYS